MSFILCYFIYNQILTNARLEATHANITVTTPMETTAAHVERASNYPRMENLAKVRNTVIRSVYLSLTPKHSLLSAIGSRLPPKRLGTRLGFGLTLKKNIPTPC